MNRERQLIGTFGPITVSVPRARLVVANAKTLEWRNQTLPAYQRLTKRAEALITSIYLAGTILKPRLPGDHHLYTS